MVRREPFGWPLRCPSCAAKTYYGKLKVPGDAAGNKMTIRCPNCDTRLVPAQRTAAAPEDPH